MVDQPTLRAQIRKKEERVEHLRRKASSAGDDFTSLKQKMRRLTLGSPSYTTTLARYEHAEREYQKLQSAHQKEAVELAQLKRQLK